MTVERIVSGGQSGVDRAALDVALELGIPCGGWCPKGRRAEDGRIEDRYALQETPQKQYAQRTEWNVRDSDGTLVIARQHLRGGTAYTRDIARRMRRPLLVVNPTQPGSIEEARQWLEEHEIRTLNIAGPREGRSPGTYDLTRRWLTELLET